MSSRARAGARLVAARTLWILLFAAPAIVAGQSRSAVDRIREADRSVVRVITLLPAGFGTGSGAVVAPGIVLTNHHVVDGGARHQVISAHTGGVQQARVLWGSPELDLALLEVDGLALPEVLLGTMPLQTGEAVWAVGFPGIADAITGDMSLQTTLTRGVISRLYRAPWDARGGGRALDLIQHDAAINPGNSGGPLISDCGMVVGVNTRSALASQGVFVASRITEAVRELRTLGIAVNASDARCSDDEAGAAREAAEAAARAAEQAVQAASNAANEAAEAAASAVAEAVGSAVEATERRMDATDERIALGLWITLGMAAVMFPTLMFLTMRAPRREVVRVVEGGADGGRGPGMPGSSGRAGGTGLYLPFRYFRPGRGAVAGAARRPRGAVGAPRETALPDLRFVADASDYADAPIDILFEGHRLRRAEGGLVIGRQPALVDEVIHDPTVSMRHARVIRKGGRFFIEDLNSREGTWVDGERLVPFRPRELRRDAVVQFGDGPRLALQSEPARKTGN